MKPERIPEFDSWYRSEYPRVLAAVAVVCSTRAAQTEDATTDAFVKAFEKWDTVSTMSSPTKWVTTVAINKARQTFRRAQRGTELLNSQQISSVFNSNHPDYDLIKALGELSYRQRRAVILHHIEGLTQAQVANDLGIAAGTASATLHQARTRLRSTLETQEGELNP